MLGAHVVISLPQALLSFSITIFLSIVPWSQKQNQGRKIEQTVFHEKTTEGRWANRLLQAAVVRGCCKDKACLILHAHWGLAKK